MYVAHIV